MRWTFAVILVGGGLIPWLLLDPGQAPPVVGPSPLPHVSVDQRWLLLSARQGLQLSFDGGLQWLKPADLPARGTFSNLVVDPAHPGVAYASNGDVYKTTDAGATWELLPADPADLAPAGMSALAVHPTGHELFAGGSHVDVFLSDRRQWRTWGAGWPAGAVPSILLPEPSGDVFAASGTHVYHAVGQHSAWRRLNTAAIGGAPVTAMELASDHVTPIVAAQGRGIWYFDRTGALRALGNGFPADAAVYALGVDPTGTDVYAATSRGLWVHNQSNVNTGAQANDWELAVSSAGDPIVALLPSASDLIAVSAGGRVYRGKHVRWQSLTWQTEPWRILPNLAPLVGALVGAEWRAPRQAESLPALFRENCLPVGPGLRESFDVCGPFRDFYVLFKYPVLGWPRERAHIAVSGLITQAFDNVELEWSPSGGVGLAPLGRAALRQRAFPRPSAAELSRATTAVIGGYYVDPLFYQFWRRNQYRQVSIFGPPISQLLMRPSTDGTGEIVPVQYFNNARLEYHNTGFPIRVSSLGGR